jgi:hypothetical protein
MIRFILLPVFVLFFFNSYAQEYKELEVSFICGKELITDVKYYTIEDNNAYPIKIKNNKILLHNKYLKTEVNELKLLVKTKKTMIEFYIKPKDIYYLKINKMPFSIKNIFKKLFIVNQGFDDEMIVEQSKKSYNFIE